MKNIDQNIEDIANAFVKGNITKEELSHLESWAHQSEANRCYVRDLFEIFFSQTVLNDRTNYNIELAIKRFYKHISKSQSDRKIRSVVLVAASWKRIIYIAAIILLIFLPIFTYYLAHNKVNSQFAEMVVKVPNGSQLDIVLSDGTKVRLNSGSRLSYSQGYGIVDRKLVFSGEGYFEVHHNSKLPFLIETKGLTLKDLGTKFKIRNYTDDEHVKVNLLHGRVEIHNEIHPSAPVFMVPGECLILDKRNGKIRKDKCDVDGNSTFNMDDLNFINMRIDDIAKQLSRSYGVNIEVANRVQRYRFYGFFNRKEDSIDEILETISSTDLVKCKHLKNKYIIY